MLLSNPFRPDPRVHKEAKALTEAGFRVRILAWSRERGFPERAIVDGIRIERLGLRSAYGKPLRFALTLPIFWSWVFLHTLASNADAVHCHDLDTLPPGWLAGRLSGKKVVFDAHELYAEMIRDSVPGFVANLAGWLERRIAHRADLVVVVNERFERIYREMGAGKVAVVMNCDSPRSDEVAIPDWAIDPKRPVLLYVGVLEPTRMVLEGMRAVGEGGVGSMVVGGFGSLEGEVAKLSASHPNLRFIGRVPPAFLAINNSSADILYAVYDPSNVNNATSVPNKLFEAMAAGKPIIVAKGSYAAEVVERERCGWTIDYGDAKALQTILASAASDTEGARKLGANGLKAHEKLYNWPVMAKRLVDAYEGLWRRKRVETR